MDTSPHQSDFVTIIGGHSSSERSESVRLNYLDWDGNGPALLFLTGIGSNAHLFDGFAPRFTDRFRVLALTRRGHGESDYPETGYDIDTLTEDIHQFLDCLHIERVNLVQHSNEGIELSHFAARYPERVEKLVCIDPAYDRNSAEFKAMIEHFPVKEEEYPEENAVFNNVDDFLEHMKKTYPPTAASWCAAREQDVRHQVTISPEGKVVYKASETIANAWRKTMFSYTPEYAAVRAPLLAIFPIRPNTYYVDPFMSPEQQVKMREYFDTVQRPWFLHTIEQFRRAAPHAQVVVLEDANTYCFITQEEVVYKAMREFLLGDLD